MRGWDGRRAAIVVHGAVTVGDGLSQDGRSRAAIYSLTGRQGASRPLCPPSSHELRRSQGRFPASSPARVVDRPGE